jgi:hypothetical protein
MAERCGKRWSEIPKAILHTSQITSRAMITPATGRLRLRAARNDNPSDDRAVVAGAIRCSEGRGSSATVPHMAVVGGGEPLWRCG